MLIKALNIKLLNIKVYHERVFEKKKTAFKITDLPLLETLWELNDILVYRIKRCILNTCLEIHITEKTLFF